MAGESGAADAHFVEQLRHEFGLDKPISTQLFIYVSSVARGDLGISHRQQRTVVSMIAERLPADPSAHRHRLRLRPDRRHHAGRRGGTPGRHLGGQPHHRARPRLLRHADLLGGPDACAGVQRMARLAAEFRHEHRRRRPARLGGGGRHRAIPRAPRSDARPVLCRGVRPPHPQRHARCRGRGFHQDCAGQRRPGRAHPPPPHPAQCPASGGDARRHPGGAS